MDVIGFFRDKWHTYPVPLSLCGIFYGALCIFSLVMGIYTMCCTELNMIEMSQEAVQELCDKLNTNEQMLCVYFGLLTFIVGVVQGISSYGIWKGNSNGLYWFAVGFTVFSLLSCSSKLFMSVNAFSIVKIVCYVLVLAVLLSRSSREILKSH